jgi:hypothetical protein
VEQVAAAAVSHHTDPAVCSVLSVPAGHFGLAAGTHSGEDVVADYDTAAAAAVA